MTLQQSAVKQYAVSKGLHILQPEKLKDPPFLDELRVLKADIQVVVAFRMLPELVWNMPPMGTINIHGSLLPQYRGAAPINWAIINGEQFTGVTSFKLQHEIDTGNILLAEKIVIHDDTTAGELHDTMKETGASLLLKTIQGLADGSLSEQPQTTMADPASLKHAPKIFTETCRINWERPVDEVYNLIRGLSPYPAAFTLLGDQKLKIFRAERLITTAFLTAGQIQTDHATYLHFACSDGIISVIELQLEGKKRMDVGAFLRGYRFS